MKERKADGLFGRMGCLPVLFAQIYTTSSKAPIRISKTADRGVSTEKNLQRKNRCPKSTLTWILRQEKSMEKKPIHQGESCITPALKEGGMQLTASTKPRISTSRKRGAVLMSGVSSCSVMPWYRQKMPKKIMIAAPIRFVYTRKLPEISRAAQVEPKAHSPVALPMIRFCHMVSR